MIRPKRESLRSFGKMTYDEPLRAWAHIRLKKDIANKFSELKDKSKRFLYKLEYHEDYTEIEKLLRKMKRSKESPPILLFIEKI